MHMLHDLVQGLHVTTVPTTELVAQEVGQSGSKAQSHLADAWEQQSVREYLPGEQFARRETLRGNTVPSK